MENVELWLEADRRGMLGPEHKALLDEAIKRGLISAPKEAAPETWGDYAKGVLRSSAQGLFGGGDEGIAAVRAAMGEDYDQALASERQALDQFRERHPVVSYGAEIATGAVLPMGAAGAALRGGASLGKVAVTGAKVGGASGAAHGFGAGQDDAGSRLGSAVAGGAVGAATGAALPVVMAGAGGVARGVGEAVSSFTAPRQAAIRDIVEAARVSGLSLDDIAAQMGAPGSVPFNVVDAAKQAALVQGRPGASLPMTNLARNAAGLGGEAEATAAEAMIGRQASQADRLRGVLSNATGGRDYAQEIDALEQTIRKHARQAYGEAYKYEKPFDLSGALNDFADEHAALMNTNSPLGGIVRKALKTFVEREIPEDGKAIPISTLSQYSAARDGLDDMITRSLDQFGKPTKATAYLTELRKSVNGDVRRTNKMFAAADDIFSDATRGQDVLRMGQEAAMRAGEKQRHGLARFAKMTPEQQELFRIGVTQKMRDAVDNPMSGSVSTARQFDRDALKNLIRATFPADRANRLLDELSRESTTTRTMLEVFGNSRTAPMSYGMGDLAADAQIAGQALSGNVRGTLGALGDKMARIGSKEKAAEIIRSLTGTDPAATRALMSELQRRQQNNLADELRRALMRGRVSGAGSTAASTATAPQPRYPALERALSR